MRRTACVDLPHFPLQLLLRRHPDWREAPVVVVDQDRPQGKILWLNERARAFRIRPGMRYASGLSLAGKLRAATVPPTEVEQQVAALVRRLQRFTPHVEPADGEPGLFWLDASGLERLHDSLRSWGEGVRAELQRAGFESSLAIGFRRFGSYALARSRRSLLVLPSEPEERAASRRVPLDRLALPPAAHETLRKLGIDTVGRFADLPVEGIGRRFGPELERLHRLASGSLGMPLQPEHPEPPAMQRQAIEHGETRVFALVALIERMLGPLLKQVGDRGRAVTEIRLGLRFERLGDHIETVRPASPTLDASQLLELIALRLQALRRLPDGVEEVVLAAGQTPATRRQLQLFAEQTRRDPAAAERALARVRASLGDDAVVRARLREGHLPEGSFVWEPLASLPKAAPRPVDQPRLIRRIVSRPQPLPPRPRQEPDGWMLRGLEQGPVSQVHGPYVVSGGWWARQVHREYHFAETRGGELLWVYYDRVRRRWYLQGRVE